MKQALMLLMLIWCAAAAAVEETWQFSSQEQQALFYQLGEELRCPKCQNQNIVDSNAVVAKDMQRKVYELIIEGQSREQILDYMTSRYGNFVHYQPPLTALTLLLWLLPAVAVVAGVVMLLRRRPAADIDADALRQAKQLLGERE